MTLWLRFVLAHAWRRPRRFALTVLGLAASLCAVFFAYGISGWVEARSSSALASVLGEATVWVVAGQAPHLDPETGVIVPGAPLTDAPRDALRALPEGHRLQRVAVGRFAVAGRAVILYADERETTDGLIVAPDLWLPTSGATLSLGGRTLPLRARRASLPPGVALTSYALGRTLPTGSLTEAWLVGRIDRPVVWGREAARVPGVALRDVPQDVPGAVAVVHPLEGSLSRFDPFSFRTKFSALTLGASMGSVFGLLARVVFLLGLGLAGASAGIGVQERRAELAVFAVNGLQSGVTLLFLIEAIVVSLLAGLLGALAALLLLRACLPAVTEGAVFGHMLGIGAAYIPLLVVVSTLIPAQIVAVRHPGALARRTV